MQYRFVFFGIDRYADPQIRDHSGAGNDARALWALFVETFPGAQSELFTDEQATAATVTTRMESALLDGYP